MKKIQIFTIFLVTLTAFCLLSGSALANSTSYNGSDKFKRGLNNTATGWLEAPTTIGKVDRERGLFEALTTGVTRGVGLAIARTGVGIYETLTFPWQAPERFEPLMTPEKVQF